MKYKKVALQFLAFIFLFFAPGALLADITSKNSSAFPQRIVSLGPINTENVFLLGAGERMVGSTVYCVRPETAKYTPKIGSVMQFSLEKLISLQPDLILATSFTQPQQLQQLQRLDIPVVLFEQPSSFEQSCTQLVELGRLLGLTSRAEEIVAEMQHYVAQLQKRVAPLDKQKVFLQIGAHPLHGATGNTFSDDYISFSGGINITRDHESGKISREKVLADNPDVIIIAIMGSETGVAAGEKAQWQNFPSIKAVHNNRIHVISPDIACSPSPATFAEALHIICSFIHPQIKLDTLH